MSRSMLNSSCTEPEPWRALERIRESGRARSIGVSNFQVEHLKRVIEETGSVFASNLVSGVLAALAAVFLYSPMVRRLHDIGRNERLAQAYLCFGIPQGFLLGKVAALPPGSLGLYAFEAALAAVTLLFIVLIFHAGEPRRNAYGAVPGRAAAAQQTGRKKGRRLKKAGTV